MNKNIDQKEKHPPPKKTYRQHQKSPTLRSRQHTPDQEYCVFLVALTGLEAGKQNCEAASYTYMLSVNQQTIHPERGPMAHQVCFFLTPLQVFSLS